MDIVEQRRAYTIHYSIVQYSVHWTDHINARCKTLCMFASACLLVHVHALVVLASELIHEQCNVTATTIVYDPTATQAASGQLAESEFNRL